MGGWSRAAGSRCLSAAGDCELRAALSSESDFKNVGVMAAPVPQPAGSVELHSALMRECPALGGSDGSGKGARPRTAPASNTTDIAMRACCRATVDRNSEVAWGLPLPLRERVGVRGTTGSGVTVHQRLTSSLSGFRASRVAASRMPAVGAGCTRHVAPGYSDQMTAFSPKGTGRVMLLVPS